MWSTLHFKHHCRNSSQSWIEHKEKSECMGHWTQWTFPNTCSNIDFCFLILA
jgi:hypothetical protein